MSSAATLTAQPRPLTVNGQVYDLHPLTIDDIGKLQSWVDRQFPDPFEVVNAAIAKGNYTIPQQQYLLSQAIDRATRPAHPIGTAEADQLLQTLEGIKQLLILSIRKGRPEFTDAEAKELYMHLGLGDLQAVFTATGVATVMSDPKGESETSSANGSSTSRRRRRR
jgi:hypothetical protein